MTADRTPTLQQAAPVSVLQLQLHDGLCGHLVQQQSGATALVFDPAFAANPRRPTATLCLSPLHPQMRTLLDRPWLRSQGLPPLLANLLPEAGERARLCSALGLSPDDDLRLLSALGDSLPGAWQARALAADTIPPGLLDFHARVTTPPALPALPPATAALAGSQTKLALDQQDKHWQLAASKHSARWLLKLPTPALDGWPENQFTALTLAQLAGVEVPQFALVALATLTPPPGLVWHDSHGLAVRRFDRADDGTRVHCEDFAQALWKAPHDKYTVTDATVPGQLLHGFSAAPQADTLAFARRLLVNVLLGNGDSHLKDWSLRYEDQRQARLAPAYDLQCTQLLADDRQQRWRIGDCSDWYALEFRHFEQWGRAVGLPWRALRPVLKDTVERARTLWPAALEELPMRETHKLLLRHHWKSLGKKLQYGL